MNFPDYYNKINSIKLYEPLSEILGSTPDGIIEFNFTEIVKVAGHACPTVAGAYLMAYHGSKKLYPNALPVRGGIEVLMKNSETSGVTGVIANVIGTILGAAGAGGFKGLGGENSRHNSIHFSQNINSPVQLRRKDNGAVVNLSYHPELVPSNSEMSFLLEKILNESASVDEKKQFSAHWNSRIEKILCDQFENKNLIVIT